MSRWQQVACASDPEHEAFDYLVVVFKSENERDEWLKRDWLGCDGPVVHGRNWSIRPSSSDGLPNIVEAVGGKVVGVEQSRGCKE